jgi:hypothetical protein
MMSSQYEQAFTTTDDQNNITYIQYIQPSDQDEIICIQNNFLKQDCELIDMSEVNNEGTVELEILESVVNIGKKQSTTKIENVKKLVQISDSGKPKGRKRLIADQTRAIRKMRANTNKPYVNAKGNEVQPKKFDEEFECTCPKKCTDPKKLSLKTRKQIFTMFWSIGTYEGRCAFICSCVNETPKKRQYTKNETSRRKNTRKYFLKGFEICKSTFTKTLSISNSRIDVSLQKMETENFNDERGRKKASHGFSEEVKEAVILHIKTNFTQNSSLRGLWNLYTATNPDNPVSESYYKRMFYENFNLKVKKVKKKSEESQNYVEESSSE